MAVTNVSSLFTSVSDPTPKAGYPRISPYSDTTEAVSVTLATTDQQANDQTFLIPLPTDAFHLVKLELFYPTDFDAAGTAFDMDVVITEGAAPTAPASTVWNAGTAFATPTSANQPAVIYVNTTYSPSTAAQRQLSLFVNVEPGGTATQGVLQCIATFRPGRR